MHDQEVNYENIARLVARGHGPEFQTDCVRYGKFVDAYVGGAEGSLLHELKKFAKGLTLVREIPSEFFGQIADVALSRAPLYIIALVKAT